MAEIKRVRRTPINGTRNKIPAIKNPDPDYVYRYVYDSPNDDRIAEMVERDYEVADSNKTQVVQTKRVGDPSALGSQVTVPSGSNKLVLMRIKKEYYEADQKAKQDQVKEMEGTMNAPIEGSYGRVEITR